MPLDHALFVVKKTGRKYLQPPKKYVGESGAFVVLYLKESTLTFKLQNQVFRCIKIGISVMKEPIPVLLESKKNVSLSI